MYQKSILAFALPCLLLPLVISAQEKKAKKKYELPEDPKAVVIRLDVRLPSRIAFPETKSDDTKSGENKTGEFGKENTDKKSDGSNQTIPKSLLNTDSKKSGDTKSEIPKMEKSDGKKTDSKKVVPVPPVSRGKKDGFDIQDLDGPQEKKQETNDGKNESGKSSDTQSGQAGGQKQDGDPKPKQDQTADSITDQKGGVDSKQDPVPSRTIIVPTRTFVKTQPDDPLIEILADGTVRCGRLNAGAVPAKSSLTQDQLQDLLGYILEEKKFYEIDEKKINELPEKLGNNINAKSFARFTFTVNLRDKQVQKQFAGIRALSKRFLDNKDLGRIAAIDRRLNELFITINVGGRKNMIAILEAVNTQLKRQKKDAPMFQVGDASFITVYRDGTMRITFGKSAVNEKGQLLYRYVATYRYKDNKSKVTIYGYKN